MGYALHALEFVLADDRTGAPPQRLAAGLI